MIVPMLKYSFLIFHKDYNSFLENIQNIGVVHIIEKKGDITKDIEEQYKLRGSYEKAIKFLEKRQQEEINPQKLDIDGIEILKDILEKQKKEERLKELLISENIELQKVGQWDDFSKPLIDKLKKENIFVRFFIASRKKYYSEQISEFSTEIINETKSSISFVLVEQTGNKIDIDADEIQMPERSFSEIEQNIKKINEDIKVINKDFDDYAKTAKSALITAKDTITENTDYKKTILNTTAEIQEKVMILGGFVPKMRKIS